MAYPVLISYNNTNEERSFAQNLIDYLGAKGIQAASGDPKHSGPGMKQELLTARWLVLILTPEAVRSPHVQSLVDTAFTYVSQGHMQGILALAFLSNPVDLEDLPSSLWSTIRIYYTGERDTDPRQAFEKLSRTLSTTKVPVRAVSSPAANWASSFSSAASRPLPTIPQPAPGPRSGLNNRLFIGLALLAILVVIGSIFLVSSRLSAGTGPTLNATAAAQARATLTAIAKANAISTAQAGATSTAVFSNPQSDFLYSYVTKQTPTYTDLDVQNTNQNHSCTFKEGIYSVHSNISGHFEACLAKNQVSKDFAFQVQLTLIGDDVGGLIFRSDSNATGFYLFSLGNTGASYTLVECKTCTDSTPPIDAPLQGGPIHPIVQPSTLTIIAYKNTFYLYVNKQAVGQPVKYTKQEGDSTLIPGEIGLYATSATQPADVEFNSVQVWKL